MKKKNRSEILREQRAVKMRGSKKLVMHRLAYHYLKVAGIELEEGETYNADKLARGLSKIYNECKKDEEKAKARITEAGEYFNSKGLSWTPEAVWRDWELIQHWKKQDKTKKRKILKL